MKILITGASSLPGYRTIIEALNEDYKVCGTYNTNPVSINHKNFISSKVDVRNYEELNRLFEDFKPNIVIHMAALGNPDLCEKDKNLAWSINVQGSINVVKLASKYSNFMIYMSTDYVFDGEKGYYNEDDPPNPINYYGLTKLMGEIISMSSNIPCAIVRGSTIYGFGPGRENFAKFLFKNLKEGRTVKAVEDQYTSPTQASLLAKAILEIVEEEKSGVFHIVGERMSRYDFAIKVAEALNLDKSLISPCKMNEMKWYAKRPKDSSLNFDHTKNIIKTDFYSTSKALKILKEEMLEG